MTSEVTYQLRNGVAWLTINRPEARNSLNTAVRDGFVAGVRWFNDDDAVKVLVLTGAGRSTQRAFHVGFVNRLAKPDDLANTDQALAEPIAANDPLSMTAG
jgi:enoyl-CoA hydratase/carnithine racemase